MSKTPRKILVRAVNWIGDAVMTLPALEAVKRLHPDASITVLARPWAAEVYRNHPAVGDILIYENTGRHEGILGKLRLARELRAKHFDTALLFQNAFDAALIAFLAGIPERVGYNRDARRMLLTRAIALREGHKLKDGTRLRHHVDYYLDLIEGWTGIDPRIGHETAMRMHPTDAERAWADSYIINNGLGGAPLLIKIIGINPGATFGSSKRWFPERFAEAADSLAERLGAGVIIFGGPAEVSIAGEIAGRMKNKPVVAAGNTSLRELAALIERCDLFITNDSGPMHIAAALDRPVVALFGSTSPEATGPYCRNHRIVRPAGLDCAPCFKRKCDKAGLPVCMERISVDMVADAAMELIKSPLAPL